ncbi:MAG: YeeE/YedE family protein [Tissierellia bacterium]|nr:YeeE/YedE family protein [Tissierellia bacterium]
MKKTENIIGFILLALIIVLGGIFIENKMTYFRLLVGTGFGYALMRSYAGFAGSVNRAYTTGSTSLMRNMMFLFVISSIMTAALLYGAEDPTVYKLYVNPINVGLVFGAFLFGIGMSFSMCCASGILTDIASISPRAIITLLFFGTGFLVGSPFAKEATWVQKTLVGTETYPNGVFLPDLFKGANSSGYFGAILLTIAFAGIVSYIAYQYEQNRRKNGTFIGVDSEKAQNSPMEPIDVENTGFFSSAVYNRLFVRPWKLSTGFIMVAAMYILLMVVTKSGWGASGPHGFWVGRFFTLFGLSAEKLAELTKGAPEPFSMPFFANPMYGQNLGIILGSLVSLLLSGAFVSSFKSEIKISLFEVGQFALGGFLMGFGSRFSNGCNVGAMFTPISQLSLSGWIFFLIIVVGAILGNTILKKVKG